jgi:ribosomal protein L19
MGTIYGTTTAASYTATSDTNTTLGTTITVDSSALSDHYDYKWKKPFQLGDRVLLSNVYFTDHKYQNRRVTGTITKINYDGISPLDMIRTYDLEIDNGQGWMIDINEKYLIKVTYPSITPYEMAKKILEDLKMKQKQKDACELEVENRMDNWLEIDRVVFNDPATIIFWNSTHVEERELKDGTKELIEVQDKTIVKCAKDDKFNKYHGFCAAVAKRLFETNSAIQRIINEATDDSMTTLHKNAVKVAKKVFKENNIRKDTKKK